MAVVQPVLLIQEAKEAIKEGHRTFIPWYLP